MDINSFVEKKPADQIRDNTFFEEEKTKLREYRSELEQYVSELEQYRPEFDIVYNQYDNNDDAYSVHLAVEEPHCYILEKYNGHAKKIHIPNIVKRIGIRDSVFANVPRGTKVMIPSSVTHISSHSFFAFKGDVHIPSNIVSILNGAFQRSTGYITFGENYKTLYIGVHAFYQCTNIRKLPEVFGTEKVRIADCAFEGCTNLETLPSCLEEVGMGVFSGCTSIRELPKKLKIVSANAFYNCTGITSIPFSLEKIGTGAFKNCTSLTEINVGPNLLKIDDNAFEGCPIEKINLALNVKSLGHDLFHCTDLKHYLVQGIPIKKFIGGVSFFKAQENWTNNIDLGNKKDSRVLRNIILGIENLKEDFWPVFNIESFKENLMLLREIGLEDENIVTYMVNHKNILGQNINTIIDNFNYIASQKVIPIRELTNLFFGDSTLVLEGKEIEEQKTEIINSLKRYYSKNHQLPELLSRLAFEPTIRNRLELRDNLMYISNMYSFDGLDENKKQRIILMLNRSEFSNIVSIDTENFKKGIKEKNPYIDFEGKYADYFLGMKTPFYRKLSGISEKYFYSFIQSMKDANEHSAFNEFMKSLATVQDWNEYDSKTRATLLKNEIIGRLLYASIEMVFSNGTIPEDKITRYTKLKQGMQHLDFNAVLKRAANKKYIFQNPKFVELMLEIDPYSFDALRYSKELQARYCVSARANRYLFNEMDLEKQKTNIKEVQDYLKEYIKKYYLEEKEGKVHTPGEIQELQLIKEESSQLGKNLNILNGEFHYSDAHIFEFINNSIGIPKLPSEDNQEYLNQMETALKVYVSKQTSDMSSFLRMLDFYIRANSENILQYHKKEQIEETAKKVFDVDSEISDHDRLLYSLYNLNKLAHSINEKHLRIDLIDKRLIDTEEEYRSLTTAIKAINELMDNGISLEETLSFIGIGENKTNELQRRLSNRSELGNVNRLEQILKHGFSLIRNKYTDFRIIAHFKETVSIDERDDIKYKNGDVISRNLKILLELKSQQVLNKTNLEKIRLLSSQRKLFFKTKQIIAEELMKKTIEKIGVSNFISMTEEQKYDFYKRNGYIVEVQRQPIRNENNEIIGHEPVLVCYSKTFNESFSVHLVGLSKETEQQVIEYINSDKYHATISHTILVNPGLTLRKENVPLNLEKIKEEQLVRSAGFADKGRQKDYLPALYNYLKFDCHDALKSNPNPTEDDLRNLLAGKFTLPKKLDLKAYVQSIQQPKVTVQTKKSISVPEPIVKVLKVLHLNFGKVPGIEDTHKRGK